MHVHSHISRFLFAGRHRMPIFFLCLLGVIVLSVAESEVCAQPGFYIPGAKKIKSMQAALHNPETFALLIHFEGADTTLSLSNLDLLDSAYNIAFDKNNPMLYTMNVEAYGNGADSLWQKRVDAVCLYFANRCHLPFPVRYVFNPIHCSCRGDSLELVRYEVPLSSSVYNCSDLPESRLFLNKTVALKNAVLITFRNNPDECLGLVRGAYIPAQDSTIRGYYTTLSLAKGAIYSVDNTKDSCPVSYEIKIDEHLDYQKVVERYFLVPHKKQIIVQAGYVVVKSNFPRTASECLLPLPDSITVSFPITQEQWDNKIRVFAKKYSDKGVEYKSLSTKKVKTKGSDALHIQVSVNATQLDTLFLGKRIHEDELDDYFFEVDSPREEGSFTLDGHHYKAFVMDRNGEYDIKQDLRSLFRIIEQEEDEDFAPDPSELDDEDI